MAILAFAAPLLAAQASAETYRLPILGGDAVLKIFLDNGVARRVGRDGRATVFEVEMEPNQCFASLRLAFNDGASNIPVGYNVCEEKGFELIQSFSRH